MHNAAELGTHDHDSNCHDNDALLVLLRCVCGENDNDDGPNEAQNGGSNASRR